MVNRYQLITRWNFNNKTKVIFITFLWLRVDVLVCGCFEDDTDVFMCCRFCGN